MDWGDKSELLLEVVIVSVRTPLSFIAASQKVAVRVPACWDSAVVGLVALGSSGSRGYLGSADGGGLGTECDLCRWVQALSPCLTFHHTTPTSGELAHSSWGGHEASLLFRGRGC